jgi:two-component system, LytTR family, sensor kinase
MSTSLPSSAGPAQADPRFSADEKPPEEARTPRSIHWGWILGVWTFVGMLRATQRYLRAGDLQPDLSYAWWSALGNNLFLAYLWAALTPSVMRIARRFAPGRIPVIRLVPIHLLYGIGIAVVHTALSHLIYKVLLAPEVTWADFGRHFASSALMTGPTRISTYLEIVGVTWGLDYYRVYREREVRASNLQAQLAEARLEALKLQLRPGFVFNALNTILPLIYRNAQAAARTVVQLGDLLRLSLKSSVTQLVSIQEEVHFLKLYLQIEKTRLADRLSTGFEIAPEASTAGVPNLILQPIVESAVARVSASTAGGGRIQISARREWDALRLEVSDDAKDVVQDIAARAVQEGNLATTRRRLDHLYGDAYRCEVTPLDGGGLRVALTLPYSPAPVDQRSVARTGPRRTGPALAAPETGGART